MGGCRRATLTVCALRLLCLLSEHNAVEQILQAHRNSQKAPVRVGNSRPVQEAITYLENYRKYMRYQVARGLGLPVGSGNGLSGADWHQPT